MDAEKARTVMRWGMIPQMTMVLSFVLCMLLYETKATEWSWFILIDMAGSGIFMYCLYILYIRKGRTNGLITSGLFRYTRHPMYTGLFLMNFSSWLPERASSDFFFFALQAVFLSTMIIAGWFQERETLVRFGAEAEEYYKKTPRLFFMYPFRGRAA